MSHVVLPRRHDIRCYGSVVVWGDAKKESTGHSPKEKKEEKNHLAKKKKNPTIVVS